MKEKQTHAAQVTQIHLDSLLMVIVFDAVHGNEDPPLGSKGPFTAEMALPHIAPTMVDVDFCVNNLCVMADFPKDLCMRVPVPKLTVDQLIERCFQKKFQLCKPQLICNNARSRAHELTKGSFGRCA